MLIYVNDIGNVLPDNAVKRFADDSNIFLFNQDISAVCVTANEYLCCLTHWFVANKLSVNIHVVKTCLVTFSTPKEIDPTTMIDNTKIVNLDHCKYFGVYMDRDLKWIEQKMYVMWTNILLSMRL